ncbi:MAG: hypothetical protein KJ930_11455 [Gammaproteobacteria bacterium]|nr:hypothetical protein [Gammaproteobacteria bacterium]
MTYQIATSCQNQQIYAELQEVLQDLNVELVALDELPIAGKKNQQIYYSLKLRLI